jgi:P-type conjugative transfer protein TrbJ
VLHTLGGVIETGPKHSKNFELQTKVTGELLKASNNAVGNLSAIQAGNAINASTVTELVKVRQLLLSMMNVLIVSKTAEVNEKAQAEKKNRDWLFYPSRRAAHIEIDPNDERAFRPSDIQMNPRRR